MAQLKKKSKSAIKNSGKDKIVLAYSGGLDTSVILKWLINTYKAEVIAYCCDVGQKEDLAAVKEKALKTGASEAIVEDMKEEFAENYIFPMLRGNALYEGAYLLGTSIARPLIAKRQIEIATEKGAKYVAHGATGKGNDQVRFELAYAAVNPQIKVIAPWREWDIVSRAELIKYANDNGIPVPVTKAKPYSSDKNLFHISYEGGILEDLENAPEESMFEITVSPEEALDKPEKIEIEYKNGNPIALNKKKMNPFKIVDTLNTIAGRNAIGRADIVETRITGMKSRGVYETPAGTVLSFAHRVMESITLTGEEIELKNSLVPQYSKLIYEGSWFSPELKAVQSLIDSTQTSVNGTIGLELYKGNIKVLYRKSKNSLYSQNIVTFEDDKGSYSQNDATGFIHLKSLRYKLM
ncbi:MAG: argininosuccinate synthase [Candidatus Acidulodesulfobacterium acidiphilum]|uniref:Argininosuccinate synthase n=1 Tax=Candidatus Acidulodesulfobacterium acidiphilum TaxID=2597224 RepID=A0A520X909_9DELT|nr:MAG: argininosuccinate synthase [Candidatus Acidulodesulfobacterium acidiphilum]